MNAFRLSALALAVFAVAAIAPARWCAVRAERPSARSFDDRQVAATMSAAFDFISPRTLEAAPMAKLAAWGLRGLTVLDPQLVVELRGDGRNAVLNLARGGAPALLRRQAPAEGDTAAWGLVISQFARAAWDGSEPVRNAGTGGVIQGFFDAMFSQFDPYSRYAPPSEAAADRLRRAGRAGIGIVVAMRRTNVVVSEVQTGGPAAQAGIRAGDRLLAVDGQSVQGADLPAVTALLAGPEGSRVGLTVQGRTAARTVVLERTRVPPETVTARRDGRVQVITIGGFSRNTASRLAQELIRARGEAGPLDGVILDLRGNRGGVLAQAVASAAMLQGEGVVVTTKGRHPDSANVAMAGGRDLLEGLPVAILIDQGTASAAEILAASLADQRRGVVVGSASQGKGLVQTVTYLPDGGELLVSWSQMLAPLGWSLQSLGVLPQVCTSLGPDQTARQIAALVRGVQPMQAALARHRGAGVQPSPLAVTEIRANCPPRAGTTADIEAARALISVPTAYAAALLIAPSGQTSQLMAPQGLTAGAPLRN